MLLVTLVACSGASSGPESSPVSPPVVGSGHGACALRKGTYSAIYLTRDGNCGNVPERIVNFGQTAPARPPIDAGPPPCATATTETADNCEVTYSERCKSDRLEKGGSFTVSGLAKWNVEGTYGTAIEQWDVLGAAGNALCTGTYSVAIRRE